MMNSVFNVGFGFTILWGLHILSVVAFLTGVIFLIALAIKTFTHDQLKKWALWLIIVGSILCLITISMTGRPWTSYSKNGFGMMNDGMMRQFSSTAAQ